MSLTSGAEKSVPLAGLIGVARRTKRELSAVVSYLRQRRMDRPEGPIRVGFLCEYIPGWNKVKPIYDLMAADDRFQPVILCVPSNLRGGKLADPNDLSNDVYDYFLENGYSTAVNTLTGSDEWLDLKTLGLSYIFYLRPYNYLLPPAYENHRVCRYCKVCMVIYGMIMTEEVGDTVMERDFFRHVYCYFAETSYAMRKNRRDGWLIHALGLQKSEFKGQPGIEEIAESRDLESPAWDFSKNDFRIMWTPRWTTDPALGGTNFFEYCHLLMEFAKERTDMDFLFRPHPMALRNFVATGEMTPEEETAFREECQRIGNISLDERVEYTATMWQSSVLVTDISGVMAEYFVTGKPLIYCASNMRLTPAEHTARMLEGCYVVHNWQQLRQGCHALRHTLIQLRQGYDPLAQKRLELAQEIFGGIDSSPSREIVEELVKDYRK